MNRDALVKKAIYTLHYAMLKKISWITICACALILTGCTQTETSYTSSTNQITTTDPQPVLSNLGGIDLARDVEFNQHSLDIASGKNVAVFLFGQPLPKNPGQPQRINPNLEFGGIKEPINLISVMDGVVAFIQKQPDSNDYEVFLQPKEQSAWVIGYDHVTDLQVVQGQTISVGDVLGKPARENNGYYRYELQINHEADSGTVMYCPTDLLETSVQANEKAKFDAFVQSWNTSYRAAYGNDAYTLQSTGGCTQPTMTAAESQGQAGAGD